jgi:predicted MFS family arabinose efflux permease
MTDVPHFSKRLFWFVVGVNFLNYFDRFTLPAVLEPLGRELLLTDEQRGILGSAFLLSYMCAAPFFGLLGDKFRRPRVIAFGIVLWSIATSASALAHSFTALAALRSMVGVGEAAYYGLGVAMLCDIIPERQRASKLTFFFLAIPLGSAVGFGLSGWLAQVFGWRYSFLVAGLPGIVLAIMMWFVRDPERGAADLVIDEVKDFSIWRKLGILFTHRIYIFATLCYCFYTFAFGALSHWGASLLERQHGVGTGTAGLLLGGATAITGIVGTFLGGYVVQRFQGRFRNADVYFSSGSLVLGGVFLSGFMVSTNIYVVVVSLFLSMTLLFLNTTPVNNLTLSSLPASLRAIGASINVFLIHALGDALSPSIVGVFSDRFGGNGPALAKALLITVPAMVISGFVLLAARRRPVVV